MPRSSSLGTLSVSPSPRKRMNDSRSLIRNSARSSERLFWAWITRILNIITGSNGGRPPFEPSPYLRAVSSSGRNISNRPRGERLQLVADIAQPLQPSSTSNNPGCFSSRSPYTRRESGKPRPREVNRPMRRRNIALARRGTFCLATISDDLVVLTTLVPKRINRAWPRVVTPTTRQVIRARDRPVGRPAASG